MPWNRKDESDNMARPGTHQARYYDANGNERYASGKTAREARKRADMKQRDVDEGKDVVSGDMSLAEWAKQCIDVYKVGQAVNTNKTFRRLVNHCIIERIGNRKLKTIRPFDCQNLINEYAGYSKAYINSIYQALNFIFDRALENRLIPRNPAQYIQRPQGGKTPRRALNEKEQKLVEQTALADPEYTIYLLMLWCGCRPSEAAEVMGRDIVKSNGEILLHIRGTKTPKADRHVPLPLELYTIIKDTPKFDYVSLNKHNTKHTQTSLRNLWRHFKTEVNNGSNLALLAPDITPYCFRHTYCTNLQKNGIDIRTAQVLMGHADIQMTANIYTHVDMTEIAKAAKLMRSN